MQAILKNPLNRDEETYRAVTTAISIVMSSSNIFFFFTYRQFCVFSLTDFQTCLFVCLAGSRAADQPVWWWWRWLWGKLDHRQEPSGQQWRRLKVSYNFRVCSGRTNNFDFIVDRKGTWETVVVCQGAERNRGKRAAYKFLLLDKNILWNISTLRFIFTSRKEVKHMMPHEAQLHTI